jgi:hypothetical protein
MTCRFRAALSPKNSAVPHFFWKWGTVWGTVKLCKAHKNMPEMRGKYVWYVQKI